MDGMDGTAGIDDADVRAMLDAAPVGMIRTLDGGRIVYANAAFLALLGYTRDELYALPTTALYFEPEDRDAALRLYRERGVVPGIQLRWRRRDGRPVDVQLYTT